MVVLITRISSDAVLISRDLSNTIANQPVAFSLTSSLETEQGWSIGFWFIIQNEPNVDDLFLTMENGSTAQTHQYQLKSNKSGDFTMYVDGVLHFSLKGSSDAEPFQQDYIKRALNRNWNYFTFSFKLTSSTTTIKRAINLEPSITEEFSSVFDAESTVLMFGPWPSNPPSRINYYVHCLFLFDAAYDATYGEALSQQQLFSMGSGEYIVLYKMNYMPFSHVLVNLLDKDKYKVRINDPVNARSALNFPRKGEQLLRYTFGWFNTVFNYDIDLIPKSPTNNSYTFVIVYKAFGTNVFAYSCPKANICPRNNFIFEMYKRISMTQAGYSSVIVKKDWNFQDLMQYIVLQVNESQFQLEKSEISMPSTATEFVVTPTCYVYAVVENKILSSTPRIKVCFGGSYRICSAFFSIDFGLHQTDQHSSRVSIQTDNYIYIFIGEIAFIDATYIEYNFVQNSLFTAKNNGLVIFVDGVLDLKRVVNDSFFDLTLQAIEDVGVYNCFSSYENCQYCEYGVCTLCMDSFYLVNDWCVVYPHVYNPFTEISNPLNIFKFDFSLSSDRFDTFFVFIVSGFKNINMARISFQVPQDLANRNENAPSDTYVCYILTLQLSTFNSILFNGLGHKDMGLWFKESLAKFERLFRQISSLKRISTIVFESLEFYPEHYNVRKVLSQFDDTLCYSPHLVLYVFDDFSRCFLKCESGQFYSESEDYCIACLDGCEVCDEVGICLVCFFSHELINDHFCTEKELNFGVIEPIKVGISKLEYDQMFKQYYSAVTSKITNEFQEVICQAGYYLKNNDCLRCSRNCLVCTSDQKCIKCDSTFELSASFECVALTLKSSQTTLKADNKEKCNDCFQVKGDISPGCVNCSNTCRCFFQQSTSGDVFIFTCNEVSFDLLYIQSVPRNKDFDFQTSKSETSFTLIPRSKSQVTRYTLDSQFIRNTTNCYLETNKVYITMLDESFKSSVIGKVKDVVSSVSVSNADIIIIALTVVSGPIGNLAIGLLQFNKVYMFVSLSQVAGGQFYNFINVNLYQSKKAQNGFYISQTDYYEYMTVNNEYAGDKMIDKFYIYTFISVLLLGHGMLLVRKVIRSFKPEAMVETNQKLKLYGNKIIGAISYRYFNIYITSLTFLLANVQFIRSDRQSFEFFAMLLCMLFLSVYYYFIIYDFIKTKSVKSYLYLRVLESPAMQSMNIILLKNRIYDEMFIILKALTLYHLRKYKKMLLYSALIITIVEFFSVIFLYTSIKKGITVIKLFGVCLFGVFVIMLIIKSYNYTVNDTFFEIVYLASNISKLAEVVSSSIWVKRKNSEYRKALRQVQNIRHLSRVERKLILQ